MATVNPQKAQVAPPQALSRALRIGVIQGGKIVEERLVRKRQNITVGQSNKNLFVVPSTAMPRTFTLFEVHGEGWLLNFTDQMDGRVAVGEQPLPLGQLRSGGQAVRRGTGWTLGLPDKARGKVTMGDVTFLFQFVAAPPIAARPQLPPSMRGNLLDKVDVFLTVVLGASLLLHVVILGVLGSMKIPDHPDPTALPDYVQEIITPPVKTAQNTPKQAPGPSAQKTPKTTHRITHHVQKTTPTKEPPVDPVAAAKAAAERVAAETAKARSYGIVGAFGAQTNDPNATSATDMGSNVDVSKVAKSVQGVGMGGQPGGLLAGKVGGSNGVQSIGTLAVNGPSNENATSARRQDTGSAGHAMAGKINVDQSQDFGKLTERGIDSSVRHLLGAVQNCYQKVLKTSPGMTRVKLSVDFTIGTHGTVTEASVDSDSGGSSDLENCVVGVIRRSARFAPPPPQPIDVTYPFILTQ